MKTGRSSRDSMPTTTAMRRAKRPSMRSSRSLPLSPRRPRKFTTTFRNRLTLSEMMPKPSSNCALEALANSRPLCWSEEGRKMLISWPRLIALKRRTMSSPMMPRLTSGRTCPSLRSNWRPKQSQIMYVIAVLARWNKYDV
ncbi:hypothetical protein PMAYCL1PPCAC_10299 [Pristionchus mayeri]|uniref:Uncharacterized protein n=1 Tax=Pristionchus mayeri TaxID=1317129 RepID=A0AAN4ZHR0_9BILA|nr:hypothetical protein PMAYCL1PPCAC_10299 [Pristionchus mayeri]